MLRGSISRVHDIGFRARVASDGSSVHIWSTCAPCPEPRNWRSGSCACSAPEANGRSSLWRNHPSLNTGRSCRQEHGLLQTTCTTAFSPRWWRSPFDGVWKSVEKGVPSTVLQDIWAPFWSICGWCRGELGNKTRYYCFNACFRLGRHIASSVIIVWVPHVRLCLDIYSTKSLILNAVWGLTYEMVQHSLPYYNMNYLEF